MAARLAYRSASGPCDVEWTEFLCGSGFHKDPKRYEPEIDRKMIAKQRLDLVIERVLGQNFSDTNVPSEQQAKNMLGWIAYGWEAYDNESAALRMIAAVKHCPKETKELCLVELNHIHNKWPSGPVRQYAYELSLDAVEGLDDINQLF
tara:strand:- start:58 stop:501 length:444 start_codon:yes stop_codon:yes gene_type:complete